MATTTNYGWTLPTNGGDSGAWGTILNTLLQAVDTALFTVSGVASAALPKAGGTMTGRLDVKNEALTAVNLGALSGAEPIDCSLGNFFYGTSASAAITVSFTNVPTGAFFVVLEVAGIASFSWPASVKWDSDTPPDDPADAANTNTYAFYTRDGGTTWRGALGISQSPTA
jgi:hypothetical protein